MFTVFTSEPGLRGYLSLCVSKCWAELGLKRLYKVSSYCQGKMTTAKKVKWKKKKQTCTEGPTP